MSLAGISDTLFWAALAVYAAAAILAFARRETGATRLAAGGATLHLGMILARALAAGRVPWGNMYEYSNVLVFLLVVATLAVVGRKPSLRPVAPLALGVAVATMALARGLYAPAGPLVPALNSWWLKIHVISAIAASSIFSLGFVFAVLYLVKDRAERRALYGGSTVGAAYAPTLDAPETPGDAAGFPRDYLDADPDAAPVASQTQPARGIVARLPAAATLDAWSYRTIAVAFPIWTFAVIAGAIWAAKAWGRYWGWDPKETWAFVTWVIYAGYLHARATSGWRGRRAAGIAIAGFVSLWITYYVVNLWIVGLHSYAGT